MNQLIIALTVTIILTSCKADQYITYKKDINVIDAYPILNDSTLLVEKISDDPEYGRIPEKPIFVGVTNHHKGGENRGKFLNALLADNGDSLLQSRYKSCCPFRTLNSNTVGADQNFGLLDVWIVKKHKTTNWVDTLYINAYDEGELIAPQGYKLKSQYD